MDHRVEESYDRNHGGDRFGSERSCYNNDCSYIHVRVNKLTRHFDVPNNSQDVDNYSCNNVVCLPWLPRGRAFRQRAH